MDASSERLKDDSSNVSPQAGESISTLDVLVKSPKPIQESHLSSEDSDPETEMRKAQALNALTLLMKPVDKTIECDRKPQLPASGELQNTCGIDLKNVYESVKQSTVKIIGSNKETIGSGFYACSSDKQLCGVLTNLHVTDKAKDQNNFTLYQEGVGISKAEVIVEDTKNDLALLKVKTAENVNPLFPEADLKPIKWAPNVAVGDSVFTVCNPTSFTYSSFVSPGRVTHTNEIPIIIDAPQAPRSIITSQTNFLGCSGGATFNRHGEVIGITRALNPWTTTSINIKASHAQRLLDNEAFIRSQSMSDQPLKIKKR